MNILYLHAHDAGRYISPYGHAIATPNLQKLAESSMLFRQAFCANPTCSPSRACLLTGTYAHTNGMLGLVHRGFRLKDPGMTLMNFLRRHGYRTCLSGIQHIATAEQREGAGYEEIGEAASDEEREANAIRFIGNSDERPWFIDAGFFDPHRYCEGFHIAGEIPNPNYLMPPAPLPDAPETREDMSLYHGSVSGMDARIGRILGALEASGQADRTIILCTTDHGIAFPRMKCNLTDHGIGVMLMLRGPGGFDGGKVCDEMVSHIDVFPTLCDVLGLERPAWLQGVSLVPLGRDASVPVREEIFAEVNFHAAREPKRCIRTTRWKYIRNYSQPLLRPLPNCDDSSSKSWMCEHGWKDEPIAEEELYDLAMDPMETHNVCAEPRFADVLHDLRGRLDRWMEETGDPLVSGPLETPPGVRITPTDHYRPQGDC